ncbi:MAG TPA: mannose-1-phosphate guanylyltransferase [Anaerolineae bacterium]|nr:mannose-1-phosphate guanylyltransferase [Anaerolineae bacterium]
MPRSPGRAGEPALSVVILAGGVGTRLWPRSRRSCPKQLLDLVNPRTMLQNTVDRVLPLVGPERIYVVTGTEYAEQAREQLPELPAANILVEPAGRGTAPCIGLAAITLALREPQGVMISLHADHVIGDAARFRELLQVAARAADRGHLVTLGIKPTYPETGYGYIERGPVVHRVSGVPVFRVARFLEKPPAEQAAQFVADRRHYWNSGLFIWRLDSILEAFQRCLPELHAQLGRIAAAWGTAEQAQALAQVWGEITPVSIDVGIMERADDVVVVPADMGWSDVGSWASLADIMAANEEGNVVLGRSEHLGLDTRNSLIYAPGRTVATIGVDDLIVVDAGDVILICPKSRAQDVKQLVEQLKKTGRHDLL